MSSRSRLVVVVITVIGAALGVPSYSSAQKPAPAGIDGVIPVADVVLPAASAERTIALPWRANVVGASFLGGDATGEGVDVEVRALTRDGWGAWEHLHVAPTETPDEAEMTNASPRTFTEPLWVGLAEAVSVRVEAPEHALAVLDVRLHISNTSGDASRNGLVRALGSVGRWLRATPGEKADAATSRPGIITRRQWGADESLRSRSMGVSSALKMVFIHHTANSNSYSKSQSASLVRGIYRYHTRTRNYSDIGYNFLIDRYGQIFEGRWGGVDKVVIGGHTGGLNSYTSGVALIGTFSSVSPPSAMRSALQRLIAWKLDIHHIPAYGKARMVSGGNAKYPRGTVVYLNRISGHRDGTSTSCPGAKTYALLPTFRKNINAIGGSKIYLTRSNSWKVTPDGNGVSETALIRATFNRTLSWVLTMHDARGETRATWKGRGTSMQVTWNGKVGGTLLPSGRYTWRITGVSSGGSKATPATGGLYLITRHPDGTLLSDTLGAYVIFNGSRYSLDPLTQAATFGDLKPVRASVGAREWFPDGGVYGLREGTILEGPDLTMYIRSGGKVRPFSPGTYTALGYTASAAVAKLDESGIESLNPDRDDPVTDVTRHPEGSVVRDPDTGEIFAITSTQRRPMTSLAFASRYRAEELVTATAEDLELPLGNRLVIREGTLMRDPANGHPWVYYDARKHQFRHMGVFDLLGFTDSMLMTPPLDDFNAVTTSTPFG